MKLIASSKKVRLVLAGLAASLLVLLWLAAGVRDAVFRGVEKSWVLQAEELGAFARAAIAGRSEILLVQRFQHLAKRDDVVYALLMDKTGRALFHSNPAETGEVYAGDYAKKALAAGSTLVQRVPESGIFEVDVPAGPGFVLRIGYSRRGFESFEGVLWVLTAFGAAALGAAGLALSRGG